MGNGQLCVDFTNFPSICFKVFPVFPSSNANFPLLLLIIFFYFHSFISFVLCVANFSARKNDVKMRKYSAITN